MKVAAHPLVVAAALGLLGPEALEGLGEEEEAPCVGCSSEDSSNPPDDLGRVEQTLFTVEAPSNEEMARVEDAWRKLR